MRGLSEASSGNAQSSATDLPLVSLLALEGGALTRVTTLGSSSGVEVTVRTPAVPNGYYILSVMTNAIHGGQLVLVNGPPLEEPTVSAPGAGALVNTTRPTIHGTAEAGSTVTVWLDGAKAGTTTAVGGTWEFVPPMPLAQGIHQIKVTAMDVVGNVSHFSGERSFTVDSVPPEAPVVTTPGDTVNTATPIISGTADAGSTVVVWLDDEEANATTITVDAGGKWRFSPSLALELGDHSVSAIATDVAGNPSAQAKHQFAVQRSHFGWGCTTSSAAPATWALLALLGSLGRRRLRSPPGPGGVGGSASPRWPGRAQ